MVPKAGFEPARVSPPPPQDGVSASSTTSARCRKIILATLSRKIKQDGDKGSSSQTARKLVTCRAKTLFGQGYGSMTEEEAPRRGGLYRNAVSLFGALIAGGSILLIVFALALQFSINRHSPYIGIFTYMVFPAFFAVGGAVFLYGMRRESLRRRRVGSEDALPYPLVDLNIPRHRKRFIYVVLGGTTLSVFMAFVTYNAFLYSESVSFCGTLCHTVMEPEYAAYLSSPHARVSCVACHVGHGASWYVKAKISGVRQVLAVTTKSYPRPIPTPIANLRPARETCEECNWPAKFFGTQLMQIPHFRYDEKNSPEQIS